MKNESEWMILLGEIEIDRQESRKARRKQRP